jgi:hypothetical protein
MVRYLNLDDAEGMLAVVNDDGDITLAYLARTREGHWAWASKDEFWEGFDFDDVCGSEGNALDPDDAIVCRDGKILGSEILGEPENFDD